MGKRERHVRSIVDGLLEKWQRHAVKKGNAVREAWRTAAGEEARECTRPVNLNKGTLTVLVDNSSWLYKLTMEKGRIREEFNKIYPGRKKVKEIRFRIGKTDI